MPTPSAPPSAAPKKRRWYSPRYIFRALLILFILSELTLRLIFGLGNPILYQPDPNCGFIPVANQQTTRFFSHIKINASNMRSDDFPVHKPAGTTRIMFLGDSVTFGTAALDQSELFTSRLAHDLPAVVGHPVEVLNASCGSWAVGNEVGFLLSSDGAYEADLIIFVVNTEDLLQPFAPYVEHSGVPSKKPFTATGEALTRYVLPRLGLTRGVPLDPSADPAVEPDIEHGTPKILAQLTEALQFVEETAHARMAIVYSPAHSPRWDKPIWQKARQMLSAWAAETKVPLLDLTDDFADHPFSAIYLDRGSDHIHLTAAAHQLVAARLARDWSTLLPATTQPGK